MLHKQLSQHLIDSLQDLIYVKDLSSSYIGCNEAFAKHIGLPVDEIIGKQDADITDSIDPRIFSQRDQYVIQSEEALVTEDWLIHHELGRRLYEIVKTPYHDDDHQIAGVIAVARDITNHWRIKHRDKTRQVALEQTAKHAPLSEILTTVVMGLEQEAPGRICSIVLVSEDGKRLMRGAAPSLPEYYNQAVEQLSPGVGVGSCGTAIATGKRVIAEDLSTHPYWAPYTSLTRAVGLGSCWSQPIFSSNGQVLGSFAIYHRYPNTPTPDDIASIEQAASIAGLAIEYHQARQTLEHQARTDRLTGIANRHYFHEQAEQILAYHTQNQLPLSLLFIDVDFFKRINDIFGHAVGDQTLAMLGEYLTTQLRDHDMVARIGGEEFAILLSHTDAHEAVEISHRLQRDLNAYYPNKLPSGVRPTLSIGVACLQRGDGTLDQLLSCADTALYEAKHQGRNRTVLFLPMID